MKDLCLLYFYIEIESEERYKAKEWVPSINPLPPPHTHPQATLDVGMA
jgi:hypothetical protein